jgi:hypothetical protein
MSTFLVARLARCLFQCATADDTTLGGSDRHLCGYA